jgi:PIN domain nuclease of toxin-antitoxin system
LKLLIDTHLLIWAAADSERLSELARAFIADPENENMFSVASIWEVAIKTGLGRNDFRVDPEELRAELLANDYFELPILSTHAIFTSTLPQFHKDPFDRILISQAIVEGMTLLTADPIVAQYLGPIRRV